jgi:dipeptidyl aminopeptidase/acylaminoacyl peptidase
MSRGRHNVIDRWERSRFALFLLALGICIPLFSYGQGKALVRIDEDVQSFAMGPDNRIVYAVQHIRRVKKVRLERDDIWISSPEGKQKKIVDGEKMFADPLLNYQVQSLAWSPDGHRIAVMMQTAEMVQPKGTKDQQLDEEQTQAPRGLVAVYLMDDEGHHIPIQGMNSLVPSVGKSKPLFEGHTFAALAWDTKKNQAFAIEESTKVLTSPMLVRLDLANETRTAIVPVDEYVGDFAVSPSGKKAGYFRDGDTLEVRDLANPTAKPVQMKVAIGVFQWGHDDKRVLLKRGDPQKSGILTWVGVYDGRFEPLLHDLVFHDFQLSQDGESVAVTEPGKRSLLVYGLH